MTKVQLSVLDKQGIYLLLVVIRVFPKIFLI